MHAPPVQYVTTPDGYDIAHTVCGGGRPFVFMPWPFSHRGLMWQTAFGKPICQALAQRFRLVQYDSRGQGMSTRGLPEYHDFDDYLTDLETVVDHLALDRFVLYGGPLTGHAALKYAVRHPHRVELLVLGDVVIQSAYGLHSWEDMARDDWNAFLHITVSSFTIPGAPMEMPYWRESVSREDWLQMSRASRASNIADLLPLVRVPTLVLSPRTLGGEVPAVAFSESGKVIAATIPDARLILYEGGFAGILYSEGPEPPPFVRHVEDFLSKVSVVPVGTPAGPLPEGISPREIDVLRLIAGGRTNQQIAAELVLSVRTVERHISNLYTKIGARGRADATAFALRTGIA
jgi:pimeloyl-ACP methyl ester carboxylesterase/DNA-binding CsgD family transcriptional regulator